MERYASEVGSGPPDSRVSLRPLLQHLAGPPFSQLQPHAGRTPATGGVGRLPTVVRGPQGPAPPAESRGLVQLRPVAPIECAGAAVQESREERRYLTGRARSGPLCQREERRTRVHDRERGGISSARTIRDASRCTERKSPVRASKSPRRPGCGRPRPRPAPPNAAEQRNGPRLGSFSRATCAAIPSAEFEVPDRRQAGLYSVRFVEVAGADHRLLEPGGYRAAVPR